MIKFSLLKTKQNLNYICEHPYTSIFLIFFLSRIGILAIAIFVQQILPFKPNDAGQIMGSVNILDINLEASLNNLAKGDVEWYRSIVDHGYEVLPFESTRQHNWAFFPLWPLTWWLFNQMIPSSIFSGLVAAHLFLLLGLINLYRISLKIGLSHKLANTSIILICFCPISYFFSFPFTESLFLFLLTSFFYCCINDVWIMAGVFGGIASATRPNGILLVCIPLFYFIFAIMQKNIKIKPLIYSFLLTISGLATFMVYLYTITGNALAFKDIQVTWGKESVFWGVTIIKYLSRIFVIFDSWDFKFLNFFSLFMTFFLAIFLWKTSTRLSCPIWGKLFSVFIVINLLVPASTNTLQSLSRYVLPVFPIFIALSLLIDFHKMFKIGVVLGFALLLGMMVTLYSFGFVFAAT